MVDILVTGKKISDMDLVTEVRGDEKIPTDAVGDLAISPDQLVEYIRNKSNTSWGKIVGDIDDQTDLKNKFFGVNQTIATHVNNKENPHEVTKAQIGLGNVDNTSDVNKPVSDATQIVLNTKADGAYVDERLLLKADKTYVDEELLLKVDKTGFNDLIEDVKTNTILEFDQNFANSIGGYPVNARVMLANGDIVRNTVANNMIDPNIAMTGWRKPSASEIFDENGKSQQELNDSFKLIPISLTPEQFYLESDGSDWLAAFQRMSNTALDLGGADIILSKPEYYLSEFLPSQVEKSLWRNNVAKSKVFYVAPNTTIRSVCGGTVLNIEGGASSPWGWETATNVLTVGDEEDTYTVDSIDISAKSVVLSSGGSDFTVGQKVQLYRMGGDYPDGTPRTPSRERAPCQIMTVANISGNNITFKEVFSHEFNKRDDLRLSRQRGNGEYPENIFWDGVTFKNANGSAPYILFSRQLGGGFKNLVLDGCSGSYGMGQAFIGDSIKVLDKDFTIESMSGWNITDYYAEDRTGASTNGILLNDNAVNWRIDKYTTKGYLKTGALILFGVNGSFGSMSIDRCGINGNPTLSSQEYTALVVGTLNNGFYGTKEVAQSPAYLRKNLGENNISIEKLDIKGYNKRPLLVCDSRLVINNAYVEYDESGDTPIIHIGDSGKSRNDATYFTDYAHSEIIINKLDIVTKNKTELNFYDFVSQSFGVDGRLFTKPTKITVAALSSDTTLTVDDSSYFYPYSQNVFFFPNNGSSIAATSKQVTEINGNVLTLDSPIGVPLAANTEIWTTPPDSVGGSFNNCFVDIRNVTVDGKKYPDIKIRPYRFLSIASNNTATLSIPVSRGINNLKLNVQDYGSTMGIPFIIDMIVNSTTSGYSAIVSKTSGNSNLNIAVDSFFMPNPNEIQIALKNNRDLSTRFYITWDLN